MEALKRRIILAIATTLLITCASCTVLTDPKWLYFPFPREGDAVLGKTTIQEILSRFGEPSLPPVNFNSTKILGYSQGQAPLPPPLKGMDYSRIKSRIMQYWFYDDVLVGYIYISDMPEDSTDFDATKIAQIRKGSTTETEVINLIGKPSGRSIHPFAERDGTAIGYAYSEMYNGRKGELATRSKHLAIKINQNGIVTDVLFRSKSE